MEIQCQINLSYKESTSKTIFLEDTGSSLHKNELNIYTLYHVLHC